jgi:hypothetical protein
MPDTPSTQQPSERRTLDERLIDSLDTLQQSAEEEAKTALAAVDHLDEIRDRHQTGQTTQDDIDFLTKSLESGD